MTVEKFMEQSLVYERAYAWVGNLIDSMYAKRRMDAEIHGDDYDEPEDINLVIECLKALQRDLSKESDRLWLKAETKTEFYDWAFEKLANAVIVRAVKDYEIAISGYGNQHEQFLLEKFAERCDNNEVPYTNLNVTAILERVRKKHEEFKKVVAEHGAEIVAETKARKAEHKEIVNMKYRCPLCGGSLYSFSQIGINRIYCTGCQLNEIVNDKKKRKKRGNES